MLRRLIGALVIAAALGGPALAFAQQPPPRPQEEFVPVSGAEQEQVPAAPLVMAAYAVAWIAIFLYLWSIWRRLARVERELADVARRTAGRRP